MKTTKIYNVCFVNAAAGEMKLLTVGALTPTEAMKTAKRLARVDGGQVIVKRCEMTDELRQRYKHICADLLDGLKTLNISGPDYDEEAAASALTIMDSLVNAFFAAPVPVAQIAATADDTTEKQEA